VKKQDFVAGNLEELVAAMEVFEENQNQENDMDEAIPPQSEEEMLCA